MYKVVFSKPSNIVIYFPRQALGIDLNVFLKDVLRPQFFWYAHYKNPANVQPLELLEGVGTWSSPDVVLIATMTNKPANAVNIAKSVQKSADKPAHVISMWERKQALDNFQEWANDHPHWLDKSDTSSKSMVSNIGSLIQKRKVTFGPKDDVREFSKRASAGSVSRPTKTMLRAKRSQALQDMARRWIPTHVDHPSGNPNFIHVTRLGSDKSFLQVLCASEKQFERMQRLVSWLPNVVETNTDARVFVLDVSDLVPFPTKLTLGIIQAFEKRKDWPGPFRPSDVAYSTTKNDIVGTPEWLFTLTLKKDSNVEPLAWYDLIQNLDGPDIIQLNNMYFPILGRNIAAIQKLDLMTALEKITLNQELQDTLKLYQHHDYRDDMYT